MNHIIHSCCNNCFTDFDYSVEYKAEFKAVTCPHCDLDMMVGKPPAPSNLGRSFVSPSANVENWDCRGKSHE